MSGAAGNRLPSQRREMDEMQREIRKLWQAIGRQPAPPAAQEEKLFSWAGSVTAATARTSGPWFPSAKVVLTCGTIGFPTGSGGAGGVVFVALVVDGATVHTFTIGGGQTRSVELIRIPVSYGLPVQIIVSGANGGTDLTFALGFVREVGSL